MKIFIKCFGCKKNKKNKVNITNSNIQFSSFITQEGILPNQKSLEIKNKENKDTNIAEKPTNIEEKDKNIANQKTKKEILIDEDKEKEKKNQQNESLITDEKENQIFGKFGLNLSKEIGYDDLLLNNDSPLINDFEKNFRFTKRSLIELFNRLWELDKYKQVWNKDNLIIEIRTEGTELKNDIHLIKIYYRQLKSEFKENAELQTIVDFLYEPNIRILWDNMIKHIQIYEGDKKSNYIVSTWVKSPVFFMGERESLEKRFKIKNPEDNCIYILSSSIPDELFPPQKNVIRVTNYCNYYKIKDEGDYIGFYSLNQSDFKMPIPQFLINVTLPTTTKNWQNDLDKFLKEAKYDKNTSSIINKNGDNKDNKHE